MKLIEIYVWNSVFWALYLPLSLLMQLFTGDGTVLGIIFIGLAFTVILSLILALMDGILWDDWEPAVVYEAVPEESVEVERELPVKVVKTRKKRTPKEDQTTQLNDPVETPTDQNVSPIATPAPISDENIQTNTLEVKPDEQKERQESKPESTDSSRHPVGVEPSPKMWTDVDLNQLDADDDDPVS